MKERAKAVKIYSHPACPWCRRIKRLLEDQGIPYQDRNVALDLSAMREWMTKTDRLGGVLKRRPPIVAANVGLPKGGPDFLFAGRRPEAGSSPGPRAAQ
jgi:glutaredoxin